MIKGLWTPVKNAFSYLICSKCFNMVTSNLDIRARSI